MSNPWEQDAGLDGDDFVEGIDDEEEELGIDYTARQGGPHPVEDVTLPVRAPQPYRGMTQQAPKHHHRKPMPTGAMPGGPKYRIKPMGAKLAARSPDVTSILITRRDGSQVLLVRGGR